ncbi:MAG TPA: serine protease [Microscillaceae bacterium]|jgi:hypothetical protein|nr:serine protease [Microscillaceae bacterium]
MLKKIGLLVTWLVLTSFRCFADEGMWVLLFLGQKYPDMQAKGLKLSQDQIYNINQGSLKDAVVRLGRGFCTGEIISKDGLLLTNHHCAYDLIQSHSSVSSDYLTKGFWAMDKSQELPNPGLTVSFLVRIEDVTAQVQAELSPSMTEQERAKKIEAVGATLRAKAVEGTHYEAELRPFYAGSEFYLLVYETFKDVRLVGAPPESIGKFGGDTDNWMWPRHTGDFSLLRVYAGPDGKPADYSPNNVPLQPKHHLPISLKGIKQGDFSMIMGYPGRTNRYLTSFGVSLAQDLINPEIVRLRGIKLGIMKEYMDVDPAVRIQYASKYSSISNYWKYFDGQTQGLKRLNVLQQKRDLEAALDNWIKADASRQDKYGNLIQDFAAAYTGYDQLAKTRTYLNEALFGAEFVVLCRQMMGVYQALKANNADGVKQQTEALKSTVEDFFKDYYADVDKKLAVAMFTEFAGQFDETPTFIDEVEKNYGNNFAAFVEMIFQNSVFTDANKCNAFLANPTLDVMEQDPAFKTMLSVMDFVTQTVQGRINPAEERLTILNRKLIAGIREMNADKAYYPDANSTMRLTYGNLKDYTWEGRDFPLKTYLSEVITKGKMYESNPEFIVDPKLTELFNKKDFGQYAENGDVPVAFISNNDITGGNSGSPVINAEGQLIGCAFDGNWEAMSGDVAFETNLQRCISVDIRYVLFVIDKVAGAGHLVNEMTLVK